MEKTLSYRVVRPVVPPRATKTGKESQPIQLLLLHGYGSNREDMLQLAPFFPECEVIAPHAPVDLGGDFLGLEEAGLLGWVRPKAYAWYRFRFEPVPGLGEQVEDADIWDMADFLRPSDPAEFRQALALLQGLAGKLRNEPGRLVVGGFSQGAALACALGLARPDLVDGVILWSGYIPPLNLVIPEPQLLPPASWPVFISHGTDDLLIPFSHAERVREYLTQRGARVTFRADRCGHEITPFILAAVQEWLEQI